MKHKKSALFNSLISLLLCISMLVGTTFAWFTDYVVTGINTIAAGVLDVELYHSNATVTDEQVTSATKLFMDLQGKPILWEPGVVSYENLRITNAGDLALMYQLAINNANENFVVDPSGEQYGLSQILKVGVVEGGITATDRAGVVASVKDGDWTTLGDFLRDGSLLPEGAGESEDVWGIVVYWVPGENDNFWNLNNGKTLNEGDILSIDLGISLVATQEQFESDSFGDDYDASAKSDVFPDFVGGSASTNVTPNGQNQVASEVKMTNGLVAATVPAGVQLAEGTTELTLSVSNMSASGSNIILGENEAMRSLDVHIEGVAENNTVPMTIKLAEAAPTGLNMGNYKLFHVENGNTVEMTLVESGAAFTAHNQFKYDPATGDLTLYMATFSEVSVVADTTKAWEGGVDHNWYVGKSSPYTIANADQLWSFSQIVGGMNGQTQHSFDGETVKLICDINLGDKESENKSNLIFYPIGYYNSEGTYEKTKTAITSGLRYFEGTFDGQGHTISNFYQNTWEMKGDHNWYDATLQYYRDGMGLFGKVYGGTVKNLTVSNFSSDGEIATTGVIAAYADFGATFENIAITNCNPRVYNIGNGGIVGCVGWYTAGKTDKKVTFTNITVDNSNKISALWGSYDVACGGIVGQYYPTSGQTSAGTPKNAGIEFKNCHVAAQMDVYNDVCGNYQYYAYRYAGMMIGSIRENETIDGHVYPKMDGISAKDCTVHYETWNDYFYCELVANSKASYTHDHQFSRLMEVKSVDGTTITPLKGESFTVPASGSYNYVVVKGEYATENATCYHFVDGKVHNHDDYNGDGAEDKETVNGKEEYVEDKRHIYLPFSQLFTGYGWGVTSKGLKDYEGVETMDITHREDTELIEKFEKNAALTGDFLYRVGNKNAFPIGKLFQEISEGIAVDSGVYVSVESLVEGVTLTGTFVKNESDWTQSTLHITGGTGPAKLSIQDYNNCKTFELIVEVVDATNLTSATGTTSGGNFVLLCDVNAADYVYYWNSTLYGNGFTYSLKGAPTKYSSSHGHGVIMTKNATLDNIKIVGDIYEAYGAYTNQDYYNAAVDVTGDTVIQNCYIANCASPVNVRSNVTIKNTTLYGGAVANLMIKSGTVTLEDVTTANYADGRALVGMGIVAHSDVSESAKLIINGTLKQHNFVNENNIPSDSSAKILYNAMFDDACSQYHFDTDEGKYVNTGIISMSALFNAFDITDNANTGYVGSTVSVNSVNGYVYTQPNTSGSVDNSYTEEDYSSATQGTVLPTISFDHTINEVAKTDSSNDYCYEESGIVYISMDEGDSFDWNTSIATITKHGNTLDYTVTMNGTDYTGKTITFNTAGDYTVSYTYTDVYNNSVDENGNVTTYEVTYTKTVTINVSIIKPTTKHAEFTFGSAGTAATSTKIGNNTYIMPNVTATSSTVGSVTVSGTTIYYPIVDAYTSDGATAHSSLNKWYMCYPVFKNVISITDYESGGTGNAVTYGSSTTTMPSGLSLTAYSKYFSQTTAPSGAVSFTSGGADTAFKYQASNSASSTPTTLSNVLIYASPTLSNNARDEMYLLVQYKYQDNAGAIYYYVVGYHMPQTTVKSVCVTPETLVTLADGTHKRIDEVTYEDQLLVWNFFEGEYAVVPSAIIFNHGYDNRRVLTLNFEDGITVRVITNHGFYHAESDSFVFIDEDNVEAYIGSSFVRMNGDSYDTVKLTAYSVTEEYTGAYSIQTALHNNFIVAGMFSITEPEFDGWFDYFEIGEGMKYDEAKKQADIEKYGLYTYEEFAEYVTYEQFVAFNGPYLKVLVGKGVVTYEQILDLIATYVN